MQLDSCTKKDLNLLVIIVVDCKIALLALAYISVFVLNFFILVIGLIAGFGFIMALGAHFFIFVESNHDLTGLTAFVFA